ncbi:MAG TPA: 5'-nucleotidase, lipoprotein e(P4) family [Gracilimonas sp.]|uniref:5'-nucleotidase, lipoprotein e(P4) family n=1 Tax=Gracilimonas sp. TaxID=1974203 RepID=UPI002D85395C|nr:5'-nucleotidase, lipoprotein e(P4) family [Gracilimonas sp.]
MNTYKSLIIISALAFTSCGTFQNASEDTAVPKNTTTQATLWVQNSAEYKALAFQTYNTALRTISLPLEDSFWTASINQKESEDYMSLPPAIILDIDETVLDNSPFQARMIKQNKSFNIEDWNAWVNEANASAVPGAVEFTNYAHEQGVKIFYISNRGYEVEEATRENLIAEGFPVSETMDNIMSNGEEPGWTSSKIQRRQLVENNYRVIMIFGDDLNDFFPAKDINQQKRADLVKQYSENFGRRWFIFPNPVYGSWEDALYDFEDDLTESEKNAIIKKKLNSKN